MNNLFNSLLRELVQLAGIGTTGHTRRIRMTVALALLALAINALVGETSWRNVSIILLVAALFWTLLTATDVAVRASKRSGES